MKHKNAFFKPGNIFYQRAKRSRERPSCVNTAPDTVLTFQRANQITCLGRNRGVTDAYRSNFRAELGRDSIPAPFRGRCGSAL